MRKALLVVASLIFVFGFNSAVFGQVAGNKLKISLPWPWNRATTFGCYFSRILNSNPNENANLQFMEI